MMDIRMKDTLPIFTGLFDKREELHYILEMGTVEIQLLLAYLSPSYSLSQT